MLLSTEKAFLLDLGFELTQVFEETQLVSLIDELGELGIRLACSFSNETSQIITCIKSLGMEAADKNMKSGVFSAAVSLGLMGQEAAENKNNMSLSEIILALKLLCKKVADNYLIIPFLMVAISIKEVGKVAARNKMEEEVILSQNSLNELYNLSICSEKIFKSINKDFALLFKDIEKCAQEEGLQMAIKHSRILQNKL